MESEEYPAWQDEYRVASKRDDVDFVVGKVKHFSQYQLYNKIRQLDEWSETLDSRQGTLRILKVKKAQTTRSEESARFPLPTG